MADHTNTLNDLQVVLDMPFDDIATMCLMFVEDTESDAMCEEFDVTRTLLTTMLASMTEAAAEVGGYPTLLRLLQERTSGSDDDPFVDMEPSAPAQPPPTTPKSSVIQIVDDAPPEPKTPTGRTSEGLRDALFATLDGVRSGKIDATVGKTVASIADAICRTVKLEMDAEKQRLDGKLKGDNGPPILRLGSGP